MEHYADQLEREIKEMKQANPKLEPIVLAVKNGMRITNFEIDYAVERDWRIYHDVFKILNEETRKDEKICVCNPANKQSRIDHGLKHCSYCKGRY